MSPVYLDKAQYRERVDLWLKYWLARIPAEWDVILFDNGSNVRRGQEFVAKYAGRVQLVRMPIEYKRPHGTSNDYLFSWRAVYAIGPLFFDLAEYDRVLHVESDFFPISERFWSWIKGIEEGWATVHVARGDWPESGFQIVTRDCKAYRDFIASGNWREHNNTDAMERILPFTLVSREFVGDRYSERGIYGVPEGADFVANMRNEDMPALCSSFVLDNDIELIGDYLGTIPATLALATRGHVTMRVHPKVAPLAALLPKRYGIAVVVSEERAKDATHRLDLFGTARWSNANGVYMTQGFFHNLGLPIPVVPPRATLELDESKKVPIAGDVGLAPFARSLNATERWPRERWQALVDAFPDVRFLLYGDTRVDDPQYVTGPNVTPFFGYSIEQAALSIRDLKRCLISVVTGLSHLAFAVGQTNVVLSEQAPWGKNPEAIKIERRVDTISVATVARVLEQVLRGERVKADIENAVVPAGIVPSPSRVNRIVPGYKLGQQIFVPGFGLVKNDPEWLRECHFDALVEAGLCAL